MRQQYLPLRKRSVLSRRELLAKGLFGAVAWRLFAGCALREREREGWAATVEVPETEDNIEGPFYRPDGPFHANFREAGMHGTPLRLFGKVLDTGGKPLPPRP